MNRYEQVYSTVSTDPVLKASGLSRTYRSTATKDPTEDVFAVLVWAASTPDLPEVPDAPQTLTVWLYSRLGLDVLDDMMPRLRTIMQALTDTDGVAQVQWLGDSGDLWDDRWNAETRNGTFVVH